MGDHHLDLLGMFRQVGQNARPGCHWRSVGAPDLLMLTNQLRQVHARGTGMARRLLAAVLADVEAHGAEAIARLRVTNPKAWCRLVSECAAFRLLDSPPAPQPRRQPRPVRMKALLQALSEQPVDPASGILPMRQAVVLPDALAAVPRGTWPQPVAVWRQAFGQAWDDALSHWLASHLPGSIACRGHDPGERNGPQPEAGSGAPAGDWLDAFGNAGRRDEVYGDGFVLRRR